MLDKSICANAYFFLATNEENRELLLFFSSIKFPIFLCSILFHHTTVSLYHWSKFGLNQATSKQQPPCLKEFTRFSSILPWQMNNTLIIKFSCSEMPCFALVYQLLGASYLGCYSYNILILRANRKHIRFAF